SNFVARQLAAENDGAGNEARAHSVRSLADDLGGPSGRHRISNASTRAPARLTWPGAKNITPPRPETGSNFAHNNQDHSRREGEGSDGPARLPQRHPGGVPRLGRPRRGRPVLLGVRTGGGVQGSRVA